MKRKIIFLILVCSTFFYSPAYATDYECFGFIVETLFDWYLYDASPTSTQYISTWSSYDLDSSGDFPDTLVQNVFHGGDHYWKPQNSTAKFKAFGKDSVSGDWSLTDTHNVTSMPEKTFESSAFFLGYYPPYGVPTSSVQCPSPPCDENQLQIEADEACLGLVDYIDTELCTYECIDSGCPEIEAACNEKCGGYGTSTCTEDENGNVTDYDCQCDDCSLETESWANAHCGGLQYLSWYDCDTDSGECSNRSCNDALQDCSDQCGGLISVYSCDDDNGTATNVICQCDGDLDQENTGDPDNTGDPATDPDPTNDGEQDPEPDDTDSGLLAKIVTNTKAASENTKALHSLADRELNELNKNTTDTNNLLRNTNKSLDSLENKLDGGLELKGSATFPDDNSYDSSVTQPEENSLTDTIGNYITAGLPLQQFLDDSGFTVSNLDPSLDCELWGYTVEFDVSPMENTLNWMGFVVFAVSTISAFMIVIKR